MVDRYGMYAITQSSIFWKGGEWVPDSPPLDPPLIFVTHSSYSLKPVHLHLVCIPRVGHVLPNIYVHMVVPLIVWLLMV